MRDIEYRFGNYRLVAAARELWRDAELVATPRLVFDCLLHLVENRSRAVGRDELVAAVWGRVDVSDGQVNQLMLRVRRTFGDGAEMQNPIRTVPGFGYRWVVDIEQRSSPGMGSTEAAVPADAIIDSGEHLRPEQ